MSLYEEYVDYHLIDNRIQQYLYAHPGTDPEIAEQMKRYVVARGMNYGEVLAITGPPDKKTINEIKEEVWVYGSILMKGRVFTVTFKDGFVFTLDNKIWDGCSQCH